MKCTIWANDYELGHANINNIKDFNALMSALHEISNSPTNKAKKFRDLANKFPIALASSARVQKLDTPKNLLWVSVTDNNGNTTTLRAYSTQHTHKVKYVSLAKGGRYGWCCYPFSSARVAVYKWDNEDWAIRVSDMDDTSYLKYYPTQELADKEFNILAHTEEITIHDILGLDFQQE